MLVFKPGVIDDAGNGHTIIDFVSAGGSNFAFTTNFNVAETGTPGANGAFYRTDGTGTGGAGDERLDFNITSNGTDIPEPASLALLGTALAGLGLSRGRRN